MEPFFQKFAKCHSHACGFNRVQSYTDQNNYVVIVWSGFSLNVIFVVVS